jgi:hypothetical protein
MEQYTGWSNEYQLVRFGWGTVSGTDGRDKINSYPRCQFRLTFNDVQEFLDMCQRCQELLGDGNVYRKGHWQQAWAAYYVAPGQTNWLRRLQYRWGKDMVNARIYVDTKEDLDQILVYDSLCAA